ncbi:MAG: TRAP transporter small permease [Gammaproteobacteria bacterium]|nr:TRAP transporter small permease [Gammaproteobacteria bacterium]MDH3466304.1 TRAP transporter small permease [Gammaproteobacteria bacterium]
MQVLADKAIIASRKLNWYVERACVVLLGLLVLDVWLGVLARYALPFQLTFTEELARYLMIWMALLAVSSGISHREHIGVLLVFERFPPSVRKWLAVTFDLIALGFFAIILVYGLGMVDRGFSRFTMIEGIPKAYPFMGVPLAALVACVQLLLVAIHDFMSSDGVTAADRLEV